VITNLEAKYKFGLSATPKRTDGLTPIIFFAVGPKVHEIPIEKLKGSLVPVSYKQFETNYFFPLIDTSEYIKMITDLSENKDRNLFITNTLSNYKATTSKDITKEKSTVILCGRIKQMELLKDLIPGSQMLTSKTPKKQREKLIKDFTDGTLNTIISSYQLFATGIDVPRLEIVVFASPMRSEIISRQATGRLMRTFKEAKEPIILDFVDNVGLLKGQAKARKRIIENIKV
jgi:superfamily II DNA or RNA helicase